MTDLMRFPTAKRYEPAIDASFRKRIARYNFFRDEAGGGRDAVFGLAPGSLGTHVVAAAQMVAPKPAAVTFEEASAVSTVRRRMLSRSPGKT